MNNNNKFRVWCEYHKNFEIHNMVIGKEGQLYRVTRFGELASPGPGHTVEWCTGIKDIHGELIYAGDILRWCVNGVIRTAPLVWLFDQACLVMGNDVDTGMFVYNDWLRGEHEIIGNIHQNPELLEVSNGTD